MNLNLSSFGIVFTKQGFILGFFYNQKHRTKCKLINFIVGQAKLAIYMSRKNKVQQNMGDDVIAVFKNLVKSRITIDFHFYKLTRAIESFTERWCSDGALCSVTNDDFAFAPCLNN